MASWLLFVAFISLCGVVLVRITEGGSVVPSWAHRGIRGPVHRAYYRPAFAAAPRPARSVQGWAMRARAVIKLVLFLVLVMVIVGGVMAGLGPLLAKALHTGG